jgi:hypothetical protein
MADVVLRVRLVSGDRLDVTYRDDSAADPEAAADRAIGALTDEGGLIRVRHSDSEFVLYGRGVAAVEVTPRGAVL